MLRRPKPEPVEPDLLAEATAFCIEAYRPQQITRMIQRGERLPLNDARVRARPEFWVAAIPMATVLEGSDEPARPPLPCMQPTACRSWPLRSLSA